MARRPPNSGVAPPLLAAMAFVLLLGGLVGWLLLAGSPPGGSSSTIVIALPPATEAEPDQVEETIEPEPEAPVSEAGLEEETPDTERVEVPEPEPAPRETATPEETADPPAEQPADAIRLAAIDPTLMQQTSRGPLPIVAPDGRAPWQVYARPTGALGDEPKVAIVIMGLGLSQRALDAAIRLPGVVSLSFSPYAPNLEADASAARAAGHEVLLDVPMEPVSYPADDPGPHTLLTSLNSTDNVARLEWLLGRFAGYVGVVNHMGSKFTVSPDALRPVLAVLNDRGLMFVDSRSARKSIAATLAGEIAMPRAINDRFIDHQASVASIDRTFEEIAEIARRRGAAVAVGRPFPVTLDRIGEWVETLQERGIAVVPVTAVAGLQADQ